LFFGPLTAAAVPLDEPRLLAAIAHVETGTRDLDRPSRRIGRAGERSAWQMKKTTWHSYTTEPCLSASRDARLASVIAHMHLRHLRLQLELYRHPVKPWLLAVAWNGGFTTATRPAVPERVRDYADRVSNLYFAR
jgi:hypothetical protein